MDYSLLAMISLVNLSVIFHHNSDSKRDGWDVASIVVNAIVAILIILKNVIK